MSVDAFELLGHDCLFGQYPSPVIAIGRFRGELVAVYPGAESELDPRLDAARGDAWVRHGDVLRRRLERFDYRRDRLFALAPGDVIYYDHADEAETFLDVLNSAEHRDSDPFLRLLLARRTENLPIILQEFSDCLRHLSTQSPEYARKWCQEEVPAIMEDLDNARVPVLAAETGAVARAAAVEVAAFVGKKILIADDQPDMVQLLKRHFERLGCTIVVAYDGQQALAAVKRDQPDLVLLDIMMPRSDGFSVLRRIKTDPASARTRVIIFTAREAHSSRQQALDLGADRFIGKESKLADLQQSAEDVLADTLH